MTLHLRDLDGQLAEVRVAPRARFVVRVDLVDDLATSVRRMLHGDLIRRAVERRRGVVTVVTLRVPNDAIADIAGSMNCRAPAAVGATRCDVAVGPRSDAPTALACLPPGDGRPLPPATGLQLRHSLLGQDGDPPASPDEVVRWQLAVAAWAESTSTPMSAGHVDRCVAALEDDIDSPAMLVVLRELEADPGVPPGAKFETFAHLDSLVGLDLAARVGQPG